MRIQTYFAYGPAMHLELMQALAPSAIDVAMGALGEHVLRFHVPSDQGTGHCNAFHTGRADDAIYGVVYEIVEEEFSQLLAAENPHGHYTVDEVTVATPGGALRAQCLRARPDAIRDDVSVYSWYREMVVAAAVRQELPEHYVVMLENMDALDDPNWPRANQQFRIADRLAGRR